MTPTEFFTAPHGLLAVLLWAYLLTVVAVSVLDGYGSES